MTQEWKKEFFGCLGERLGRITEDNILAQNPGGEWYLKTILAASAGVEDSVLVQAAAYQARKDVLLLELYVLLSRSYQPQAEAELRAAMDELNSFLPVGVVGISPRDGSVYLRDCFRLLTEESADRAAQDAYTDYEMVMEGVMAAYPGLKLIWTGEKTFAQVVELGLLKKYS